MQPEYPSLARALAETLVDLAWFVEGAEDEQIDPDDAVKALEGVAAGLNHLSDGQRSELLNLLGTMAQAENDPARRQFLEGFPIGFGLVEEDSD